MKVLNIGSINIDHVYELPHFVQPGETLASKNYSIFSGGKGANQSTALARAGAAVMHAGRVGAEGVWVRDKLADSGVDTRLIETVDEATGHAVIQVNSDGENAIIIHGGANRSFSDGDFDRILAQAEVGDYLLLQNEINGVNIVLEKAAKRDLTIIFNPAPMTDDVKDSPLELVNIFIVNETEGEALTGERDPKDILDAMMRRFPQSSTVLTLGKKGVIYGDREGRTDVEALKVKAVDTTAAGDTFIGYFVAQLAKGSTIKKCLEMGVKASALCVTREGAGDSIPYLEELNTL